MKKIFILSVLWSVASLSVWAGFIDGAQSNVSVAAAKEMRDETPVKLKGNLVQRIGNEKYLFSDGADTIAVEIDDEVWGGQDVSPQDTVLIVGEMDKDLLGTEIDVETIQLIK